MRAVSRRKCPRPPSLASRPASLGITRQEVRDALWETRTLVRTNGPRDTKHILPADELPLCMAAMKAASSLRPQQASRSSLSPAELKVMLQALADALNGLTLTREQLAEKITRSGGARLREPLLSPWGEYLDQAFYEGLLVHGPGEGNQATFARADQWVGSWEQSDPQESLAEICRRYISSYGPVTHQDFARWFGIERDAALKLFENIKGDLEGVKFERRRTWILASDAEEPWEPVEESLRLVPQYDCYVLGSYPRPYIVPDTFKAFLSTLESRQLRGRSGLFSPPHRRRSVWHLASPPAR